MQRQVFFQKPFRYVYYNAALILTILNVVIFLLRLLTPNVFKTYMYIDDLRGTVPWDNNFFAMFANLELVAQRPWTLVTALFIHGDVTHLVFNMFSLLMLGSTVEQRMGSHEFVLMYFVTGVLGNLLCAVFYPVLGIHAAVFGASVSLYAVMLAFGTYFPNATLLIMFVIPMKAYMVVIALAVFSVIAMLTGIMGSVSHLGHLSGLFIGFLYFIVRLRTNPVKEIIRARRYSM